MNCTQFDLKALSLGELGGAEKARAQEHIADCPACREEFERLEATRTALFSLREEEMPRRIAFVSDQVFEPRWWQRVWRSGPALAFASAAMLSLAILVHAFAARPSPAPAQAPPAVTSARVDESRIAAEVERRLQGAVQKAVAESEERQSQRLRQVVASAKRDLELQRDGDRVAINEAFTMLQKKMNVRYMASADLGGRE